MPQTSMTSALQSDVREPTDELPPHTSANKGGQEANDLQCQLQPTLDAPSPPPLADGVDPGFVKSDAILKLVIVILVTMWFARWQPTYLWGTAGVYYVQMFGITGGFHRFFSHRAFKATRLMTCLLGLAGVLSGQEGPLFWATQHRHHHHHCGTEKDIQSPEQVKGGWLKKFVWAQWVHNIIRGYPVNKEYFKRVCSDWAVNLDVVWLENWHTQIYIGFGAVCWLTGGADGVFYWWSLPTFLTYHATHTINSLCHLPGYGHYQTYRSADGQHCDSYNIWYLLPLTLGESWHNNHHAYKASARQGFEWYELDPTYLILRFLEKCGLVWDLRMPYKERLEELSLATQ